MARCAIKVELLNDSYTELKGEIAGPPDTPYEGGNFVLEIKVPETYPFNPPKVLFFNISFNHLINNRVLGSIYNENMASEYIFGYWSYLFRYFKGSMVISRRNLSV